MAEILSHMCRICLEQRQKDLLLLDSIKIKMIRYLKIEMIATFIEGARICNSCNSKLQISFNFKKTVLSNLNNFNKGDGKPVINIEDIIPCDLNNDVKLEAQKVCLLCLKYHGINELIALNNVIEQSSLENMMVKCLPEIEFHLITEPFLCNYCVELLHIQFKFTMLCFNSEEVIKSYGSLNNINSKKVKLSLVFEELKKIKNDSEECSIDLNNVKNEYKILSPNPEIKFEDNDVNEKEMLNSNSSCSTTRKKRKIIPKAAFTCPYCPYENYRKSNLDSHLLVHEKLAEAQFKCDVCSFSSKWRSSLLTHKLLHKKATEVETFKCYNCNYETIYKKHLRRHMKQHQVQMYFCKNCKYKTKMKSRYESHKCKVKNCVVKTELLDEEFQLIKPGEKIDLNINEHTYNNLIKAEVVDDRFNSVNNDELNRKFDFVKTEVVHDAFDSIQTEFTDEVIELNNKRIEIHSDMNDNQCHLIKTEPTDEKNISIETEPGVEQSSKKEYKPEEIYMFFSKVTDLDTWYYICNKCNHKTRKMSNIKDHVLRHQNKREEKCNLCDYRAKYKKTLKAHVLKKH